MARTLRTTTAATTTTAAGRTRTPHGTAAAAAATERPKAVWADLMDTLATESEDKSKQTRIRMFANVGETGKHFDLYMGIAPYIRNKAGSYTSRKGFSIPVKDGEDAAEVAAQLIEGLEAFRADLAGLKLGDASFMSMVANDARKEAARKEAEKAERAKRRAEDQKAREERKAQREAEKAKREADKAEREAEKLRKQQQKQQQAAIDKALMEQKKQLAAAGKTQTAPRAPRTAPTTTNRRSAAPQQQAATTTTTNRRRPANLSAPVDRTPAPQTPPRATGRSRPRPI